MMGLASVFLEEEAFADGLEATRVGSSSLSSIVIGRFPVPVPLAAGAGLAEV